MCVAINVVGRDLCWKSGVRPMTIGQYLDGLVSIWDAGSEFGTGESEQDRCFCFQSIRGVLLEGIFDLGVLAGGFFYYIQRRTFLEGFLVQLLGARQMIRSFVARGVSFVRPTPLIQSTL